MSKDKETWVSRYTILNSINQANAESSDRV